MKVIVIGAGVVGVTTAWYLMKHNHDVTVVEQSDGPGTQTSFGNAGGVCPGFAGPWAAPGMPFKAFKWMFQSSAPLLFRPRADFWQWRWLVGFVRNCTASRFEANKARMQLMAHYSKACLADLRKETGISYDHAANGVLQIFSTDEEYQGGERSASVLERAGTTHRLVDRAGVDSIEPALAGNGLSIRGGLHLPTDETGDCHLFCQRLTQLLEARGCQFHFNTRITRLVRQGQTIQRLLTDDGSELHADAFVVACGPFAPGLLRTVGINLDVYPVKGYSMTWALKAPAKGPQSSVMDEHEKLMITRLGDRMRVAGMAEVVGFDRRLRKQALTTIRKRTAALFPGAADYEQGDAWCGFRPMTPGGPATVGATRIDNLYINAGHGSNGWTQACGTSKFLAAKISGETPDIEY